MTPDPRVRDHHTLEVDHQMVGRRALLRIEADRWAEQGRRRSNWIIMMIVFGPLAVLLFFGSVRQFLLYPERYEEIDGVAAVDR